MGLLLGECVWMRWSEVGFLWGGGVWGGVAKGMSG